VRLDPAKRPLIFSGYDLTFRVNLLVDQIVKDVLPITGGDLTQDNTGDTLRVCNLVVPGMDKWVPGVASDPLWPTGNVEMQLFANMDFGVTTSGDMSLGVFRVQRPVVTMEEGGSTGISVSGYDRSATVARATLRKTYSIPAGSDLRDIATDIVSSRIDADIIYQFPDDPITIDVNLVWDRGDDPWAKLKEALAGHGFDLYFDADGNLVIEEIVDPIEGSIDFVHEVVPGRCAITGGGKSLDDAETYNHIIAYTENTDNGPEVWAEAFDADPASPTFIGSDDPLSDDFGKSDFGDKPRFVVSQLVIAPWAILRLARTELIKTLGIQEVLEITTPWMPHEANDVAQFVIPNLKVANTYVLDVVRMTLDVDASMSLQTRQRRTTGVAL
jgi:hypothetical protein